MGGGGGREKNVTFYLSMLPLIMLSDQTVLDLLSNMNFDLLSYFVFAMTKVHSYIV